jgi:putative glutamine amidotransferase
MRPLIGISGPDKGGGMAWFFTALNVRIAGGKPVRIRPSKPGKWKEIQGLIIGGGADIDPRSYTENDFIDKYLEQTIRDKRKSILNRFLSLFSQLYFPFIFLLRKLFSRKHGKISEERDQLEFKLLDHAVEKNIPVLGICRGGQLINVYFKGSLIEDISSFYYEEPNPYSIFPVKDIYVDTGSKLGKILGITPIKVNALHHQAVSETGEDILAVAHEKNKIIQGIEHTRKLFILGVQWHPEYLIIQKRQRNLFRSLVEHAFKK